MGGFRAQSASKVPPKGIHHLFGGEAAEPYVEGEAMTHSEIAELAKLFAQGARNAIAAGFDGVEIHGTNIRL